MKIVIIGLGLIGGSIGLALKNSPQAAKYRIIGIPRRSETIQRALDLGAIDEGTTDYAKGCQDADLVFICTPINLILPILTEIAPHLKKGSVVTDVGSSKHEIVAKAEKITPKGVYFIGGHPMAGKESTKLEAAEKDFFREKTWLLTKTSKTSQRAVEKVMEVVRDLGATLIETDPKTHDLTVGAISHMPLAIASALVLAIAGEEGNDLMKKCAASGFRDATRIASGDPVLGVDMFTTNKQAVLKMISAFKRALSNVEKLIKEGNGEKILAELEKAKKFRDSIYG